MKIKFLNIITILSLSLNADIIISADNLPNVSKEFLQHNFKAPIGINLFDKNYMDALNAYNSLDNQLQYNGAGDPIYLFSNSARGRTFIVSFEYKY